MIRALWTRASPAPVITISLSTLPPGALQMRPDRELLGRDRAEVDVAASDETGVWRPSISISAATPRPVPGPRMTCGPAAAERERADAARPVLAEWSAAIKACASKSLSSNPCARPARRAVSGPSITQGALVSLRVRSATGPAPQAITERGRWLSFGAAASIASGRPG